MHAKDGLIIQKGKTKKETIHYKQESGDKQQD